MEAAATMEGKRCSKCGQIKALEEFHADKARKDGRQSSCKVCQAARRQKAAPQAPEAPPQAPAPMGYPAPSPRPAQIPAKPEGLDGLVAIKLSVHYWAGQTKMRAEDLGLKPDELPEDFHLGYIRLYPLSWFKQFTKLEGQARNWLFANSYPYIVDEIRCVPARNLAQTVAKIEEFGKQMEELAGEFLKLLPEFKSIWELKYTQSPKFAPLGIWERLEGQYPTDASLASRFGIGWQTFILKAADAPQEAQAPELIEAYDKGKAALEGAVNEMIGGHIFILRKKIMKGLENLSGRLKGGEIVRNDTLQSVRNLVDWYKDMNYFGNLGLDDHLQALKGQLEGVDYEGLKDNETMKKSLADLADKALEAAEGIKNDVSAITGNYRRMIDLS